MKKEKTNTSSPFIPAPSSEFQTPMPVCSYMAGMVPFVHSPKRLSLLEPTPGDGNLVRAMKHQLGSYCDITAPRNFFDLDKDLRFDCIVMNPPFSAKYAFGLPEGFTEKGMRLGYYMLTECMKMSDNVIALMPWFTLSDSDVRMRFLKEFGIVSLTTLPRKTFKYARIQTVVIELQKGYTGQTIFKVFEF